MIPTRWHTLEPLLDQALDADADARKALLAQLQRDQPELARALEALLAKHQRALDQHFLLKSAAPGLFSVPLAGQQLGTYTLVELLGEGGMGSVWLARRNDGRFEGHVAIKLLSRGLTSPMMADRFRREGQILARLNHPHIAHLLDAGVSPHGQPYLVLEHVRGLRIDDYADTHRLNIDERLRLFLKLLDAVAQAHRQLVVHRDIKPSNVMVTDDGQVKLLDFGVAKLLEDDDGNQSLTQHAGGLLTPGYAAPEQVRGEPALPAADVFALGVLMSLLLTGRHPFLRPGDTTGDALRAALERSIGKLSATPVDAAAAEARGSSPTALGRLFKGDLDTLAAKAMARDPSQRFSSAADFALDLRRHLAHEPILAHPPTLGYRMGKFVQRQRLPLAVAALGLVAAVALGTNAWQQQRAAALSQAKAQSVDGLLASLFEGMSPAVAQSRRFEARELLQRGQAYLSQDTRLDTISKREVLMRMAALYEQVGAHDEALAIYEAEEKASLAQNGRSVAYASVLWLQANLAYSRGEVDRAKQLMARLSPLVARQANDHPGLAGRTAMLEGELAEVTGNLAGAAAAYDRAERGLAAEPVRDVRAMGRLEMDRGFRARSNFELDAAWHHFEAAQRWYSRLGTSGDMGMLELDVEQGVLELWMGRPLAASTRLERSVLKLQSLLPENHEQLIVARAQLAFARLRLGHFEWVHGELNELSRLAIKAPMWLEFTNILRGRLAMYEGRAEEAEPLLRASLASQEARAGVVATGSETVRRLHAESLLRLGRLDAAEAALRRTQAHLKQLSAEDGVSQASNDILLGCLLARRGQLEEARSTWYRAHAVLTTRLGNAHPTTLVAASYLALSDAQSGRPVKDASELSRNLLGALGWQDGTPALAQLLLGPPGAVEWAKLPVVL